MNQPDGSRRAALIAVAMAAALAALPAASWADPIQVSSCGTTLVVPDTSYVLTQDVTSTGSYCIVVLASNVEFDLAGHTIQAPDTPTGWGMLVAAEGAHIRNGAIRNFTGNYGGILLLNFGFVGGNRAHIEDMTLSGNKVGIYALRSVEHRISNNRTEGGAGGIYLSSSHGNAVSGNTTVAAGACGICVSDSNENDIHGNRVSDGELWGITIRPYSSSNSVYDNDIVNHGAGGIVVSNGANDNLVIGNRVSNNANWGIMIALTELSEGQPEYPYPMNNTVALNYAHGNGTDLAEFGEGCPNIWDRNDYDTKYDPWSCIADDVCPNTPPGEVTDETGCSISQICDPAQFANPGARMLCTVRASEDFSQRGLITEAEQRDIIAEAAKGIREDVGR